MKIEVERILNKLLEIDLLIDDLSNVRLRHKLSDLRAEMYVSLK